jgi:uncharacterized protein YutE (UPF0331/DUF86 family)
VHSIFPSKVSLDWPTVVVVCIALFVGIAPKLDRYLPLIKKLKIGQAELELQQQAEAVAVSVDKIEAKALAASATAGSSATAEGLISEQRPAAKRLQDTTRETQIVKLASTDRIAAILLLAIEIEREALFLTVTLGLRNRAKTGTFREAIQLLTQQRLIDAEVAAALMEFYELRNQIVHARVRFDANDPVLISALDSGLRLLRALKTLPRPIYRINGQSSTV